MGFKGKMVESMRKSTENLSGLLDNNSVTTSPTGDPLAADAGDSGTCLPFFPSILSSEMSAGKDGNYQLKKKRSTLSFFKGKALESSKGKSYKGKSSKGKSYKGKSSKGKSWIV